MNNIERMIDEKVEEFRKQLIEETKKLVEEQKQKEEVFPKVGDEYWFVSDYRTVTENRWDNDNIDNHRLALNNVYKTKEEAEFALEKLEVIAELKKFAEPKDRKWDRENSHWYLEWRYNEYEFYKKEICISNNEIFKHNEIYFESKEKALEAIKAVGEERIKKYYLEVE